MGHMDTINISREIKLVFSVLSALTPKPEITLERMDVSFAPTIIPQFSAIMKAPASRKAFV